MRWLLENWIDALIFAVFAVTVVGIVLFLTGVNPFKQKAPGAVVATSEVAVDVNGGPQEAVETGEADQGSNASGMVVVPLLPGNEAGQGEDGTQDSAPMATVSSGSPSGAGSEATSVSPSSGAGAGVGAATGAKTGAKEVYLPSGPEEGVFRVSVGAFKDPDNALALAKELEAAGYPVRLEPVGGITRVVVGPYSSKSKAAAAARRLSKYEPRVYRGDTPPVEGTYLQVGAYKKLSSAAGLIEKLRSAGVGPIVLNYQKPWLKVWVGPIEAGKLDEVRQKLQSLGLQAVEVH